MGLEDKITWEDVKQGKANSYDYYKQECGEITRGELAKKNSKLYQHMIKDGNIKLVPVIYNDKRQKTWKTYQIKYTGKTQKELNEENRLFYVQMEYYRLLENIPEE